MKRTIKLVLDVEVKTERGTLRQAEALAREQFRSRELCYGISAETGVYSVSLKRTRVQRGE